jgi:hypothetical protein
MSLVVWPVVAAFLAAFMVKEWLVRSRVGIDEVAATVPAPQSAGDQAPQSPPQTAGVPGPVGAGERTSIVNVFESSASTGRHATEQSDATSSQVRGTFKERQAAEPKADPSPAADPNGSAPHAPLRALGRTQAAVAAMGEPSSSAPHSAPNIGEHGAAVSQPHASLATSDESVVPESAGNMQTASSVDASATTSAPLSKAFDGIWSIRLRCGAVEEKGSLVKGFEIRLPANITEGLFRAQHGQTGTPGSLTMLGTVKQDATLELTVAGLTGMAQFNLGHEAPGHPYSYLMSGVMKDDEGSAQRRGIRPCSATLSKQ